MGVSLTSAVEKEDGELTDMSENQEPPNPAATAGSSSSGVRMEAGPPHEALFLVLSYLPLFELLSMRAVCVSLRDAVEHDVLPWLHILVDRRLSSRLSDYTLGRIARKAGGRLRTLALINCFKISDSGLHEVVEKNPLLTKVFTYLRVNACVVDWFILSMTFFIFSHNVNLAFFILIYTPLKLKKKNLGGNVQNLIKDSKEMDSIKLV